MRPKTIQFDASRGPDGKVRVGVWDRICVPGHDEKDGQSTDFDLSTLSQMVDNFLERADPIPVDHNHQSNYAAQNGQPAPALAWYGALAVVDGGKIAKLGALPGVTVDGAKDGFDGRDGLWGYRHEVTELGEQLLPNFKLLSPTFLTNGTRRNGSECGYCLLAVAATNTPWQPATKITFEQESTMAREDGLGTYGDVAVGDKVTCAPGSGTTDGVIVSIDRMAYGRVEARVRGRDGKEYSMPKENCRKIGPLGYEQAEVAMANEAGFKVGDKVRVSSSRAANGSDGPFEIVAVDANGVTLDVPGSPRWYVPNMRVSKMERDAVAMASGTRFRVLDKNDKYCGHWYAADEAAAIRAAIAEGYDAWSAKAADSNGYERGLAIAEFRKACVSMANVGERYYWDGDMANDPGAYVVTANRGDGWLAIKNEKTGDVRIVPDALMTTSRWRKMERGDDVATMALSWWKVFTERSPNGVFVQADSEEAAKARAERDGLGKASRAEPTKGLSTMANSKSTTTNAGAAGFTQRGNQMKLKKLAAFMAQKFGIQFEAGADEDDKKVGAMAKACMDGEAAEAMGAEGYDYGSGANTLEEMAKLYEDAHLEPDGDEEPPQAAMRRMAAKFRKMGQPAASMAFPPKDEDADSTELGAFAQQLGIDPRGKSRAQLMSALRAVAVPASRVAEAAKVAAQEAIAEDRARLALAEKKAAAAVLMEQLPASYPGNREALKRLAESDPEEAALLAAPFIKGGHASAPANIFSRMTQNGAPVGKGKEARHDTGLAPKTRTVKSQAFGTIQIDDDAFAAEIERVADSKDPVTMGRIDSMLAPHDRAQKSARLIKAERIVREESPHLVPDGE